MSTAAARAPELHQPLLSDLVMITPHVLAPEHCARLIDRFEAQEERQTCERPGGHSFTQIEITQAWPDEEAILLPLFLEHFRNYQRATGSTYWPRNLAYEHLRMKRYLPNGRDWFPPHVDVIDQLTARRFMTAFIYLNAPKGGETVFPTLGLVVPPETGKLLSFPPLWLFPHEGRAPIAAPKYILHTYLCYGD